MSIEYQFTKSPVPVFIGFEGIDSDLRASNEELYRADFDPSHYPFYTISKDKTHYKLDIHISGFKQDHLDILVEGDILSVLGTRTVDQSMAVVFDGMNQPGDFVRRFRLADNLTIDKITYVDGVLSILVEIMFVNEREGEYEVGFGPGDMPKKKSEPVIESAPVSEQVILPVVVSVAEAVDVPVETAVSSDVGEAAAGGGLLQPEPESVVEPAVSADSAESSIEVVVGEAPASESVSVVENSAPEVLPEVPTVNVADVGSVVETTPEQPTVDPEPVAVASESVAESVDPVASEASTPAETVNVEPASESVGAQEETSAVVEPAAETTESIEEVQPVSELASVEPVEAVAVVDADSTEAVSVSTEESAEAVSSEPTPASEPAVTSEHTADPEPAAVEELVEEPAANTEVANTAS
jgi:HSP20 family molecular chaperone IbpA